jgi:flavin reductase (DIM6/NTAB) family NADH-FMN oxidoreductase RutF
LDIDNRVFRQVLSSFATGVTIVTTQHDGELFGMTASAFTSVSLEPPLVLVCIDSKATTSTVLQKSGVFAVSFLGRRQESVSDTFARRGSQDKFQKVKTKRVHGDCPIIEGAIAFVECRLRSSYLEGDHFIFVGQVLNLAVLNENLPLIFFKGKYCSIDLQTAMIPSIGSDDNYMSWLWPSS